ncbi:MAG: glutamate--cysteine ligase [Myxococcales bacterium]|nr:glutamate--cysteine ligase [Myxococcales bacterium]
MGIQIDRERFEPAEYVEFQRRLEHSLKALEQLLQRPGFGVGAPSLGAEIELSLVDAEGSALPLNRAVLAASLDDHLQLELDRFNLEYNLTAVPAAGRPFSAFEREIGDAIAHLDGVAASHGGRIIPIGILPSLVPSDLDRHNMSDLPRYRALSRALKALRHSDFEIRIDGEEPLATSIDDVTMEGAATSLQVHLRVDPQDFAAVYNAAQLATAPALAVSANSPIFLGHRLWRETRIALFKQAVDPRPDEGRDWHHPPRVGFGHGFVRQSAHELFAETVALFPPLIPITTAEDPLASVRSGAMPALGELRLHMGTVWRWNRPVFDPDAGGHLRIELRALPSGPTPIDSAANAAYLVGLTMGLARRVDALLPRLPFEYAERNFYRAAQQGLDSGLVWAQLRDGPALQELPAAELARELLPVARAGLETLGVDSAEIDRMLGVIEARIDAHASGARYQLETLARLERRLPRQEALLELTRRYLERSKSGSPVHEWSVDG